jgi:hypothetical protein
MKKNSITKKITEKVANKMLEITPEAVDIGGLCVRLGGKDKLPKMLKK